MEVSGGLLQSRTRASISLYARLCFALLRDQNLRWPCTMLERGSVGASVVSPIAGAHEPVVQRR